MNDDRMDDLIERTLAKGSIPADATTAERAEVESLLEVMGVLQAARGASGEEARVSMAMARARFQRYIAANQPSSAVSRPVVRATPRPGFFGRLVGRGGVMAMAGSAAGVAVLGLAAVLLWQLAFSSPTAAYAQMVDPGDYVQVEGVVEDSADGAFKLKSELGTVEVELSDTTALVDAETAEDLSTLRAGDRVLVGGIAGQGRKLAAQTVALSQSPGGTAPKVINFRQLKMLRADLEGQVVTYTISNDGTRGAVLIEAANGDRFLVQVDGKSAEQLLARASTALGQRVKVQQGSGTTSGTFSLEIPTADSPPPEGTAGAFVTVRGVVMSVESSSSPGARRILDGTAVIQTLRGPVTVVVRASARVFPGESGLTPGAGSRGEATGHTVVVTGGIDRKTGNVIADAIVMGPKLERPQR